MIVRQVHDSCDVLLCTNCREEHPIDRHHHVALNLVEHYCGDPAWTIPPRPTRAKNRGGRP